MKKIILLILFLIGMYPVFNKGKITINLVQASYANGYGSEDDDEIAFCAGMDFFGNSLCEVETDCNTGGIINIFSCIDMGGGDDGGNNGGEEPCYYNCDDDYPPYEEPPYEEDPEDCNGTPGGGAYWSSCGCIGGTTGIGSCPDPNPDPPFVDCNGVTNGTAYMANCGCIGGTTGITECPTQESENICCECLEQYEDLTGFTVPDEIDVLLSIMNQYGSTPGLPYTDWEVLDIEDGYGGVNLDKHELTITQLPINPNTNTTYTKSEFYDYIRKNIMDFVSGDSNVQPYFVFENTNMEPYSLTDGIKWNSNNALGTIMHFDAYWAGLNVDDLTVICSDIQDYSWKFTTIQSPGDLQHPVSGTREFGLRDNTDGSFTFYTRGADRLTGIWDAIGNNVLDIFDEGTKCWQNTLDNLKSYIDANQGSANKSSQQQDVYKWQTCN